MFLCHIIFVLWHGGCCDGQEFVFVLFMIESLSVFWIWSGFAFWLVLKSRASLGCVCFTFFVGEFDPGSGRTLAACLTHASRTERPLRGYSSGERVSNTWVICPKLWDKPGKLGLILDMTFCFMVVGGKLLRFGMGPRPISLLVG